MVLEDDEENESNTNQHSNTTKSSTKKKNKLILPSHTNISNTKLKTPLIEEIQEQTNNLYIDNNYNTNINDQEEEDEYTTTTTTDSDDSDSDNDNEGKWIFNEEELSIHQQAIIDAIRKDALQAGIDISALENTTNNLAHSDTNMDIQDNNNDDDI